MSNNLYVSKVVNGKKDRLHRHIVEAHIGRTLEPYEHVYHKDGDSKNNDIGNLVVIVKRFR